MEGVVHELVEEKHAVEASMLPFDGSLHSVEHVKEVWNLIDVQVVLIIAVLEQLYASLYIHALTERLRTESVSEVQADHRNEWHDRFRGAAINGLVTLRRLRHDGLVADHRACARLRSGDLHRLLLRALLHDRHVHLLVVGVGRRRVGRGFGGRVENGRDGDVGGGGRRRQRCWVEHEVEGYRIRGEWQ